MCRLSIILALSVALGGCSGTLYGSGIGTGGHYFGAETASAIDDVLPCTSAHERKFARHKVETISWWDRSGIVPRLRTREISTAAFGRDCGGGW